MASTSAARSAGGAGRIRNSISSTLSDNQSLLSDIRKSIVLMKDLAVDLEKKNQSRKVKELEEAVIELLKSSENCQSFACVFERTVRCYLVSLFNKINSSLCVECKHIYDKKAIMQYMKSKNMQAQCPVAGCPRILHPRIVVCDPLLRIEIEEMRTMSKKTATIEVVEDFTELDGDD